MRTLEIIGITVFGIAMFLTGYQIGLAIIKVLE